MKHFRSLLLMLLLLLALCVGVSAKNECRLYDMTLKTESGEALDHISKGYSWASVSAKKTGDLNATILLATYDSAGCYLGLYTMRANVPTGTVYELGALVDNTAGKIAALKAFAVDSLSGGPSAWRFHRIWKAFLHDRDRRNGPPGAQLERRDDGTGHADPEL